MYVVEFCSNSKICWLLHKIIRYQEFCLFCFVWVFHNQFLLQYLVKSATVSLQIILSWSSSSTQYHHYFLLNVQILQLFEDQLVNSHTWLCVPCLMALCDMIEYVQCKRINSRNAATFFRSLRKESATRNSDAWEIWCNWMQQEIVLSKIQKNTCLKLEKITIDHSNPTKHCPKSWEKNESKNESASESS